MHKPEFILKIPQQIKRHQCYPCQADRLMTSWVRSNYPVWNYWYFWILTCHQAFLLLMIRGPWVLPWIMGMKKHFKGQFTPWSSWRQVDFGPCFSFVSHLSIPVKDLHLGGDNSGPSELLLWQKPANSGFLAISTKQHLCPGCCSSFGFPCRKSAPWVPS